MGSSDARSDGPPGAPAGDGHVCRQLDVADAAELVRLRREMLTDSPLSFLGSLEDDPGLDLEVVRERLSGDRKGAFGAFEPGGALVAHCGLVTQDRLKLRHKAIIVGVYTSPSARRRGLGARLLEMALEHARSLDGVDVVALSASPGAHAARALYARFGFREWGVEPRAIRYRGVEDGEVHMTLDLDA